jgi:NAD(P)-dependent dehydrogenase (short-subunit alcohol dehydrogenase family)
MLRGTPQASVGGSGVQDEITMAGRRALVVGGGSGIGRATALLLARGGARVAVADFDAERAKAVAEEAGGFAIVGDVTDPTEATRVVDEAHEGLGGLDAVANIVGVASWVDVLSLDAETWERDMRNNLTHHLYVGQAAAHHMIAAGGGAIAMVASVSGMYGAGNHAAYGAAKAGAMALARSMAMEWGPHGIRVNCVAPDVIATPRVVAIGAAKGIDDMDSVVSHEVMLGRWGAPEEIAGPLVFLLSDLAGFMTGQTLVVDGGTMAMMPHTHGNPLLS